jgi:hypothetical protein
MYYERKLWNAGVLVFGKVYDFMRNNKGITE